MMTGKGAIKECYCWYNVEVICNKSVRLSLLEGALLLRGFYGRLWAVIGHVWYSGLAIYGAASWHI